MWVTFFQNLGTLARPLGSRIIRYVRNRRTNGRTEKKQRLLPPSLRAGAYKP